jgi:hypothetical protein
MNGGATCRATREVQQILIVRPLCFAPFTFWLLILSVLRLPIREQGQIDCASNLLARSHAEGKLSFLERLVLLFSDFYVAVNHICLSPLAVGV